MSCACGAAANDFWYSSMRRPLCLTHTTLAGENNLECQEATQRQTSNFEVINQPRLAQLSRPQYHQGLSAGAAYG